MGLTRSGASAQRLRAQGGMHVVRGKLSDLAVLTEAAKEADGVIHATRSGDTVLELTAVYGKEAMV